ncbi:acyltransferase [Schizosaccharomyces japonicus yFS275]|uniref:Acyltransferase n=1 Tax=Schizosaccharomyces japonicus (strain yFS275 / FY16936) TaxID=402676 RepID=B6K5R5_SCHJY|nr:acyltransferase [Schizosaccharomyces japonicus yFS275]EEB08869.1 acyltransferase [Schizosaccharomyces japonicus yFS275]
MEKFTRWRDPSTGIAPFYPIRQYENISLAILIPLRISLSVIRGSLVAFVFFVYFVLTTILNFLFGKACPKLVSFVHNSLLQLILFLLGFLNTRFTKIGSFVQGDSLQPGDIIAVNHTSPIDVLILALRYNPVFVASYADSQYVTTSSTWTEFKQCFNSEKRKTPVKGAITLSKAANYAHQKKRLLVVFPEGFCSNGRAICKFTNCLTSAGPQDRIFLLYIKYMQGDLTLGVPSIVAFAKTFFSYFVFETRLRFSAEPIIPRNTLDVTKEVSEQLAKLGRVRQVQLGLSDREEFLQYWFHTKRGKSA